MKNMTFPQMLVYISIGILLIYSLSVKVFFVDSDIFWHIENGRYMIEHQTIIKHAIHTFTGSNIPYVPHEWLYDIIVASSFLLGGWNGVMVLTFVLFAFLSYTIIKLMQTGVEENEGQSLTSNHFVAILLYIIICMIVYTGYKAYLFSIIMVMWFFIFLRRYHRYGQKKEAVWMVVISLLFANIHGGLWIVMFAFFMMMIAEKLFTKAMTKKDLLLSISIVLAGCINPDGIKTFIYTFVIGDVKDYLQNFSAIQFDGNQYIYFIDLAIMLYFSYFVFAKNLFHKFFVLGLLFLGTMSYYHHIYMIIMIPYLIGTSLTKGVNINVRDALSFLTKKTTIVLLLGATCVSSCYRVYKGEDVSKEHYPVDEMAYILKDHPTDRPKVLTDFNSSGYAIFKGANVLADSRVDPFVQPETKNKEGETAAEQLFTAYSSEINNEYLGELAKNTHVDYVIIPDIGKEAIKKFKHTLGKPDFKGSYGYVWKK